MIRATAGGRTLRSACPRGLYSPGAYPSLGTPRTQAYHEAAADAFLRQRLQNVCALYHETNVFSSLHGTGKITFIRQLLVRRVATHSRYFRLQRFSLGPLSVLEPRPTSTTLGDYSVDLFTEALRLASPARFVRRREHNHSITSIRKRTNGSEVLSLCDF